MARSAGCTKTANGARCARKMGGSLRSHGNPPPQLAALAPRRRNCSTKRFHELVESVKAIPREPCQAPYGAFDIAAEGSAFGAGWQKRNDMLNPRH